MATKPVRLPTLAELELADWKIGSLMSDLDLIEHTLAQVRVEPATVEEYLANPDAYGPQKVIGDAKTMLRLYVFCDELESDGRRLIEYSEKFKAAAEDAYRYSIRDMAPGYEVGRDATLEYHRESIEELGGDNA